MFEVAEVGNELDKKAYKALEPQIHQRLLELQQLLRKSDRALIIIISGVEGAGKGEVVDALNRWFDIRDVETHAFFEASDEETERPLFWRYWRALPARGTIGVLFGSWYSSPIVDYVYDKIDDDELALKLQRIEDHETTLTGDGYIIVKLWFHLTKSTQQSRLKQDVTAKFKKSPLLKKYAKSYDKFIEASERAIRRTDIGCAPWHIIEATDPRYRDIESGRILISSLERRLSESASVEIDIDLPELSLSDPAADQTVLDSVNLSLSLSDKEYEKRLERAQSRLHHLAWTMHDQKKNAVMVFEGWDAAGKGSAIRRITASIDARLYRAIPISAPTDEEKAHHYLWRFWRQLPRAGFITIYDRSWYGRVLVERVEGYATPPEWRRAYEEINEFEQHLLSHGVALCKFWIHISNEEQLARFQARERDTRKQHKITKEDWRNREHWDEYKRAVHDMVAHTSTSNAPWHLVSGNDKRNARVEILEAVCANLESLVNPE